MNLNQFLTMKLHQGSVLININTDVYRYGEFNRRRSALQVEFREGRPKSVVVPENIDAVR